MKREEKQEKFFKEANKEQKTFKIGDILYAVRGGYVTPRHNIYKIEIIGEEGDYWITKRIKYPKRMKEQRMPNKRILKKTCTFMYKTKKTAERIKRILDKKKEQSEEREERKDGWRLAKMMIEDYKEKGKDDGWIWESVLEKITGIDIRDKNI